MPTISYAAIGQILSAVGESLAANGGDEAAAAARHLSAAGAYFEGIQGAVDGEETAGHIIAGIVGGVLIAEALPVSTMIPLILASPYIAALPPVAAGLAAAAILAAGYYFGSEAIASVYDVLVSLTDLLADILADPIVLDLDGNGIELIPLKNSAAFFDLDGDGVAERVGWASPQDGFLVHDSNGNGIVDGVDEMLGSANVDGFDELDTFDSNNDGRINSLDSGFADLRVWRDLNSDGISTPDEIQTLTEAGIASLNLSYSQANQNVAGNVIARTGTYVRADGTVRSMGSVNFALEEPIPVLPENADLGDLVTLPNLSGILGLPDLRTAMFFDPTLKSMVEDLTYGSHGFDTFAEFRDGGFLDVLYRWAGIDTSAPLEQGDQPYYVQLIAAFMGRMFDDLSAHQVARLDEVWDAFVGQLGTAFLVQAADLPALQPFYGLRDDLAALSPDDPNYEDALISVLSEAMNASVAAEPAYGFLDLFEGLDIDPATGGIVGNFDAFVAEFLEDQPRYDAGVSVIMGTALHQPSLWLEWYEDQGSLLYVVADLMGFGAAYVDNATGWAWLRGGVTVIEGSGGGDVISAPSGNQAIFGRDGNDELRGNDGNDRLIGGDGNDLLLGGTGSDMYVYASGDGLDRITEQSGTDDTIYFSNELDIDALIVTRVAGTNDLLLHFGDPTQGIVITNQWTTSAIEHFNFGPEGTLHAGDVSSIYLATFTTEGADTITGSWADERLVGLGGDDNLSGAGGDDVIEAGDGNDLANGGDGHDTLTGGAGDDTLIGMAGNDRLVGGTGNDLLKGGDGNDTFVFGRGDGQDIATDYISLSNQGGTDTVELGPDITPDDITVVQDGYDLIIRINGTTDQLTLSNTMNNLTNHNDRIEQVRFADGTIWTHTQLLAQAMLHNDGNDTFYGGPEADTLTGGAGDDTLIGMAGNDRLVGGTGNDLLKGGDGNDTFVFGRGDGQDIATDYISLSNQGGTDTVELGPDITPDDITVVQDGYDLIIRINGTTDQLTLSNTMNNLTNHNDRIEQVRFADGTIWTHTQLLAQAMLHNDGNDTFYGGPEADTLTGGAGDDTLIGMAGNDRLVGGTGNDLLKGGDGNDTFVFGRGDGQDIATDYISLSNQGGTDTVELGPDITPDDITVVQDGYDLIIRINGTTDQLTLSNTMNNLTNHNDRIEQVRFADGTIWTHTQLLAQAMLHNDGNDTFYGGPEADTLTGGAGNDILYGMAGNDTLIGGTGNDVLNGGTGVDTVTYADATSAVTVSLATTAAQNTVGSGTDTISNVENIVGGGFGDILTGSTAANLLIGGDGDDIITGGAGNDTIDGGFGSDIFRVAGTMSTYSLATSNGQITLTDTATTVDGNDGTDILTGIETIQFKDQSIGIVSPILLDLNGDGVHTVDANHSHSAFDMDGDGLADRTSWISRQDGFLFLDRDGNGTVSGVAELSFINDMPGAASDLAGLRAFDSDGDGILSAADYRFGDFKVWQDRNGNGTVEAGEILSLAQIGLQSIDLNGQSNNSAVRFGDVAFINVGSWTRVDGQQFDLADAAMTYFEGDGDNMHSVGGLMHLVDRNMNFECRANEAMWGAADFDFFI